MQKKTSSESPNFQRLNLWGVPAVFHDSYRIHCVTFEWGPNIHYPSRWLAASHITSTLLVHVSIPGKWWRVNVGDGSIQLLIPSEIQWEFRESEKSCWSCWISYELRFTNKNLMLKTWWIFWFKGIKLRQVGETVKQFHQRNSMEQKFQFPTPLRRPWA